MATLVIGPHALKHVHALSDRAVGLVLGVGPLAAMVAGIFAGDVVDHLGSARTAHGALLAVAVAGALLASVPIEFGVVGYSAGLIAMTVSYTAFRTANNTAVMRVAPTAGRLAANLALSRNIGLAVGSIVWPTLFFWLAGAPDTELLPAAALQRAFRGTFLTASFILLTTWIGARGLRGTAR